jgi:phosphoglycolate phosphatase
MTRRKFCVIFDLDGTLVDTAPDLTASLNVVLDNNGRRQVEESNVRHMVGHGARQLILRGFALTGAMLDEREDAQRIDELVEAFLRHYQTNLSRLSRPFAGVEPMLRQLSTIGTGMAICTNKRESLSLQLLRELSLADYFGAIIGGDTLPQRKPEPEPLLEALRRLNGVGVPAVMVGDSDSDVKAARAASLPVILVSYGYTPVPAADLQADAVIDSFMKLPDAIGVCLDMSVG